MATGREGNTKRGDGKGFAGLASLVSDVDTTSPALTPKTEPSSAASSAERLASQPDQPQPQPQTIYQDQSSNKEPAKPSSGWVSSDKWLLGLLALLAVSWLIAQSDKPTSTSPAPAYSPPVQSAAPSRSPQTPSRPTETEPPVGQALVLSRDQIRYCLAEDIRLDGARSALNNYSDYDVDRFNMMVADFNSRCGNFRYRTGALEGARREIEPYQSLLLSEGRSRFARPEYQSSSPPAQTYSNAPTQSNEVVQSNNSKSNRSSSRSHYSAPPEPSPRPCIYKGVMTNEDYLACGINPPSY